MSDLSKEFDRLIPPAVRLENAMAAIAAAPADGILIIVVPPAPLEYDGADIGIKDLRDLSPQKARRTAKGLARNNHLVGRRYNELSDGRRRAL